MIMEGTRLALEVSIGNTILEGLEDKDSDFLDQLY